MQPGDVLSGQGGLEGIRWALRGPAVKRALRSELGALLAEPSVLGSCLLRRAKWKPGRRLTAYYDVRLLDLNRAGHSLHPIEVDWRPLGNPTRPDSLTDQLAPEVEAMQAEAIRLGLVAPFRRLAADLPTLGVRIQISPLDTDFPQLVRLSDPGYVRDRLADVGSLETDISSRAPDSGVAITTIRYRPGQRHVLRYDRQEAGALGNGGHSSGGRSSDGTFFAKPYASPGEGARRFRVATRVADWLAECDCGVTGARPTAYLAEDETVLYPMVSGMPLSRYLDRPREWVGQRLRVAGTALRCLHTGPESLADELELKTIDTEIKAIARASEHVSALLPKVGAKISETLELASELHQQLPQEPPSFTHSDLKADHLWVTQNGLTLIDFDTCSLADPASDIGKFLADLQWWYAVYGQAGVEQAQKQFISGYALEAQEARLARSRLYEALILVKITVRRVPLFDRNWVERTEWLVDCAGQTIRALAMELGHPAT